MTTEYTPFLRLALPDFRSSSWHEYVNNNMEAIDASITNALVASNVTVWANDTSYGVGALTMDDEVDPPTFWINTEEHTSPASPTTFAQDRVAHPTRWSSLVFGITPRGEWDNDTDYGYYDIAYDPEQGIAGLCLIPHTSNSSGDITDDAANWVFIIDLPSMGSTPANNVSYDNTDSALPGSPANVQDAIEAVDTRIDNAAVVAQDHEDRLDAAEITIAAQGVTLAANSSSIGTLDGRVDTLEGTSTTHESRIDDLEDDVAELGSGFPATTAMLFWQASAPTGWTKSTTHNDKALRVVSGTGGGNGGTNSFSSTFSKTTTDATTLTTGTIPSHAHSDSYGYASATGGGPFAPSEQTVVNAVSTGSTTTGSVGSGGSHTHPMDIRVQYLDLIICVKD